MSATEIRHHPAWFGAVMGTGATSVAVLVQSETWALEWLAVVAVAFLLAASVLAVLLWPRYLHRLSDRSAFEAELRHPGHGAMLATFPAGLLVLAVAWGRVGPEIVPVTVTSIIDGVLLVVGMVIALGLGVAWAGAMARDQQGLASVNGGWLIPPVMNLLVPLALVPIISRYPEQAPGLLLVGFAFLGIGTVLFLALFSLLVARVALEAPLPSVMAPSLWIPLAPAGILGFALLKLLQAGEVASVPGFASTTAGVIVTAMGIGLGLWWSLFAGVELLKTRRAGGLSFHPGWWGFVFPIAAMTLAIAAVGEALDVVAVEALGAAGTILLLVVWVQVAVRTVGLVRRSSGRDGSRMVPSPRSR